MIKIKTKEEQEAMRRGGRKLAAILSELQKRVEPGVKKVEIDNLAHRLCLKFGVKPSFRDYEGFPGSVCISVGDEVVHGLPDGEVFKSGDLVSLDMGVFFEGFHTDSAVSFICGKKDEKLEEFISACEQSLCSGISVIRDGAFLGDVSAGIQETAESFGYGVVRMLVGHGIGAKVHEEPPIPNHGSRGAGPLLKAGMTLAIEPMLIEDGTVEVFLDADGWAFRSKSGALTVHAEETVLVTDEGSEVLTKR